MTKTSTAKSDDSAKKKALAKKAAAKKPAAKAKAPVKKPAAKPAKGKRPEKTKGEKLQTREAVVESPETIEVEVGPASVEVVEDAELLAETPVEAATEENDIPELTPEERELQAIYGDVSAPAHAHAEYTDQKTADEDRPMMPEINAREERKAQWQDRRDRRRQRREDRDRQRQERRDQNRGPNGEQRHAGEQRQGGEQRELRFDQRPPQGQPGQGQPPQGQPVRQIQPPVQISGEADPLARVGTPLGDAAATVFAQLRNGQPLPVRQLAAMMRKRNLVEVDPEQLAPQLKAELLGDERSYRALGLRPRIVYRGRDLFAPGPVAMSQTADAEAGIASALSRLAGATHRALALRIAKASPAGFERLIHAYLVAAGYREITWIKRVGGISYAQATAPGIGRSVLISARSGDQPIDRRGIGELRVGVEAKDLVAGILFSAPELSEDAERELERAGRSIAVVCGDQLVAALIASGVGVVSAAAPLHYVDDQLLDELLAG